jgi:hypothetical protein
MESGFLEDLRKRALIAHDCVYEGAPRPAREAMGEHLTFARLLFEFDADRDLEKRVPDARERDLRVQLAEPALLGPIESDLHPPVVHPLLHAALIEWTEAAKNEMKIGPVGKSRVRDLRYLEPIIEKFSPPENERRQAEIAVRREWVTRLRSMGVEPVDALARVVGGLAYERQVLSVGKSLTATEVEVALEQESPEPARSATEKALDFTTLAVETAREMGILSYGQANSFGNLLLAQLARHQSRSAMEPAAVPPPEERAPDL